MLALDGSRRPSPDDRPHDNERDQVVGAGDDVIGQGPELEHERQADDRHGKTKPQEQPDQDPVSQRAGIRPANHSRSYTRKLVTR